jgi:hypothetical protein
MEVKKLNKRKYDLTIKETLEWAKSYPKVKNWLTKLQREDLNARSLWLFCKSVGKDPDELLALKDDPKSREAEYLLDDFVADESLGLKNSVKVKCVITIKSFFKYNYRELARASGQISFIKQKPYRKHTKEELLKIYRATQNPRDRALITFTWSTGIARETLQKIQWKHLDQDWEGQEIPHIGLPPELIKGHGRGRYKGVEQHTFLTPEAKRDLIDYRDWLKKKGVTITPDTCIFLQTEKPHEPLDYGTFSKIPHDLSDRSGIPFSFHDARRYVETALEETKINPNWARKIRGRKVKGEEAPYSRPAIQQLREAFREAIPLLMFTEASKGVTKEDVEKTVKKQFLLNIAKNMGLTEKELKGMLRGRRITRIKDEIDFLEEIIEAREKERKESEDCPNGKDCGEEYKQIPEANLLQHLREGWQIVHRLQTGEVIVKK